MTGLWSDIRYALRSLGKTPGFVLVAIATMALGIGANTAIFSVVNKLLFVPLPYAEPDRLVSVWEIEEKNPGRDYGVSYPNFLDWKARSHSFEAMAGYRSEYYSLYPASGEPVRVLAGEVTADMFRVLRTSAKLGRGMHADDDQPGAAPVLFLSNALWKERFGGDPLALGQPVRLDDTLFTIVGVMPQDFSFPPDVQIWIPLGRAADLPFMKTRSAHVQRVLARLAPGATMEAAQREMTALAEQVLKDNPGADFHHGVRLISMRDDFLGGDIRQSVALLAGAVAFVLLIACANVASLLLSRAASRKRELAARVALGASRWDLVRLVLTESLLIAAAGGFGGVLLALWGVDLLAVQSGDLRLRAAAMDARVLAFTFTICLLTGVGFALASMWQAARLDLAEALRQTNRSETHATLRLRSGLVVSEVALSLVLLVGAGLLIRSLWRVMQTDPGFRTEDLILMTVALPDFKYTEVAPTVNTFRSLQEKLEALPGVRGASAVSRLPISGGDGQGMVSGEGLAISKDDAPSASYRRVLPNYFRVMGIRLVSGREFDARDTLERERVTIISQGLARRLWPAGDAVGKRIKVGPPENEPWLRVVGVVGEVRNIGMDVEPAYATYESHAQRPWTAMNIVVRTAGPPLPMVGAIQNEVRATEKDALIYGVGTMQERIFDSLQPRRFLMTLLATFAGAALLLAAVGIYGVMSYAVTQRGHEIGIRMALGAQRGDIFGLVVRDGMLLAGAGVALGLAGAFGLTRLLQSLLFGVKPTDPLTFTAMAALLAGVALAACYVPARRATRVDPIIALRYE